MLSQDELPPATGSGSRLGSAVVIVAGKNLAIVTTDLKPLGVFASIATCISLFSIWLQLKNYRKPILQRYVVRILLMCKPRGKNSNWQGSAVWHFIVVGFKELYSGVHYRPYTRRLRG
jgi:hypothetical protein